MTRKQKQLLADALQALDDTVAVLATNPKRTLTDAQWRDLVRAHTLMFQAGIRIDSPDSSAAQEVPATS